MPTRERVSTATGQPARQTAVDLGVQRPEHGRQSANKRQTLLFYRYRLFGNYS